MCDDDSVRMWQESRKKNNPACRAEASWRRGKPGIQFQKKSREVVHYKLDPYDAAALGMSRVTVLSFLRRQESSHKNLSEGLLL